MTIRIENASHDDCVLAAVRAAKTKVVSCPNPADAASPVYLHMADRGKSLGQSADYRHDLDSLASIHSAALVQSWWDQDAQQWTTTIDGIDQHEAAVVKFVLARQQERDAKIAVENRAKSEAARQQEDAEEKCRVAAAMELCRQAAEQWAPGRVALRLSRCEVIVGRWDAPFIPGSGMPAEVRRVVRGDSGQPVLVACLDSYRHLFA